MKYAYANRKNNYKMQFSALHKRTTAAVFISWIKSLKSCYRLVKFQKKKTNRDAGLWNQNSEFDKFDIGSNKLFSLKFVIRNWSFGINERSFNFFL